MTIERGRRLAKAKGRLGPSVPADFFVWSASIDRERPWLTRIGGSPWREDSKPWPKDAQGIPLHFLGQICFADSKDLLKRKLPGDVALIFGRWDQGWAFIEPDGVLEWSSLKLKKPYCSIPDWWSTLPFEYQGVIHRSVQYLDHKTYDPHFESVGYESGFYIGKVQATSIGSHAGLSQGWPFREGDGKELIATLSSIPLTSRWPLCDVPSKPSVLRADGSELYDLHTYGLEILFGDMGCIWIYRDKKGKFHLDWACG